MAQGVPYSDFPAQIIAQNNRNYLERMNQVNQREMQREELAARRGDMILGKAMDLGSSYLQDNWRQGMEKDLLGERFSLQETLERQRSGMQLENEQAMADYGLQKQIEAHEYSTTGLTPQQIDADLEAAQQLPGPPMTRDQYVAHLQEKKKLQEELAKENVAQSVFTDRERSLSKSLDDEETTIRSSDKYTAEERDHALADVQRRRNQLRDVAFNQRLYRGAGAAGRPPEKEFGELQEHPVLGWGQFNNATGEFVQKRAAQGGGGGAGGKGATGKGPGGTSIKIETARSDITATVVQKAIDDGSIFQWKANATKFILANPEMTIPAEQAVKYGLENRAYTYGELCAGFGGKAPPALVMDQMRQDLRDLARVSQETLQEAATFDQMQVQGAAATEAAQAEAKAQAERVTEAKAKHNAMFSLETSRDPNAPFDPRWAGLQPQMNTPHDQPTEGRAASQPAPEQGISTLPPIDKIEDGKIYWLNGRMVRADKSRGGFVPVNK
jgi:hypothetical protein